MERERYAQLYHKGMLKLRPRPWGIFSFASSMTALTSSSEHRKPLPISRWPNVAVRAPTIIRYNEPYY